MHPGETTLTRQAISGQATSRREPSRRFSARNQQVHEQAISEQTTIPPTTSRSWNLFKMVVDGFVVNAMVVDSIADFVGVVLHFGVRLMNFHCNWRLLL